MIKVGIIGGAGYTAGELIRILLYHPEVSIEYIHSESQVKKLVSTIHNDLIGEVFLTFTDEVHFEIDAIFLCMGHGRSRAFLEKYQPPSSVKIIDLSNEFRLKDSAEGFVYGLPELNKEVIKSASKIANPGCFATAIQLAILPLAKENLLQDELHIHAITGSTGAGQQPKSTTHFSWRNNNISIYKAFRHQHLGEIQQSVRQLQPDFSDSINFLPVRGDFSRGIFASIYLNCHESESRIKQLYLCYYESATFTHLVEENPVLKQVVNTNKCLLYIQKEGNKVLIISVIDNLLKGASGQAVQNMNLMFGLSEQAGLSLKAVAF